MRPFRLIAAGLTMAVMAAVPAAVSAAPPAAACTAGPVPQILVRLETLSKTADPAARRKAIAALLARWADKDVIARTALHGRWASLSASDRAELADLLRRLTAARVSAPLSRDGVVAFAILEWRPIAGSDCLVASRVLDRRGRPRIVHWRMRTGAHGPRFVDLLVDGISITRNLRDELDAILRDNKGDIADLRARLRATVARAEGAGR